VEEESFDYYFLDENLDELEEDYALFFVFLMHHLLVVLFFF